MYKMRISGFRCVCVCVLFIHTRISRNNLRTISGDRFSLDIVSAIAYIHTIMNRTEDVIATTSTRERGCDKDDNNNNNEIIWQPQATLLHPFLLSHHHHHQLVCPSRLVDWLVAFVCTCCVTMIESSDDGMFNLDETNTELLVCSRQVLSYDTVC
jgi:hypothetical protein